MARFWLALAVVLSLAAGAPAAADSWLPPRLETYASPDGQYRLTVIPRGLTGPLGYFEDKVDGKEPAGQRPGAPTEARGLLERRAGAGWETVWARPLVNDVSPVRALVSPSGDYVVTFDNWHSTGYGDDVVVIYGPGGTLVRKMALTDFLPQDYVAALPRSVSSMQWAGRHRIDGGVLLLAVALPDDDDRFVEVRVDLATGQAEPPSGPVWEAAVKAAAVRNAEIAQAEAEYKAWLRAPLAVPTSDEYFGWARYLIEAYRRLSPIEGYPDPTVLPARSDDGYASWRDIFMGILREGFGDREEKVFVGGSPDQENLVSLLLETGPTIPRGKLKGVRVYLAVSDKNWPRVVNAFNGSGAEMIQITPDRPIPQRPGRMPE